MVGFPEGLLRLSVLVLSVCGTLGDYAVGRDPVMVDNGALLGTIAP